MSDQRPPQGDRSRLPLTRRPRVRRAGAPIAGVKLDDVTIERVVRVLNSDVPAPLTLISARLDKQKRDLALAHAAGELDDATYLARMAGLRQAVQSPRAAPAVDAAAAVAFLRNLPALLSAATDESLRELMYSIYERIEVTRDGFGRVHLTPHAYRYRLALALPETVSVRRVRARPAGAGLGRTTCVIPIVARRAWQRLARPA